jgi:hypothetical protein
MGWSIESIVCGDNFLGYAYRSFGGNFDAMHCGRLQGSNLKGELNCPGKPYVSSKSADEILAMADEDGFVWSTADAGSGQCAALVKAAIPALGATRRADGAPSWCKGDAIDVSNASQLLPGTAIGYGFSPTGEYLSLRGGNHVAILVSVSGSKVRIIDQWQHPDKEQPAQVHEIEISDKDWAILTRSRER